MNNEYYGAPSTPNDDFLAHYGIKGMKWGVRKAIERGNERALGRQYKKAQKKLAKLEKRAANGKKYAKRAAALGAGAAAAGGLALAGTRGIGIGVAKAGGAAANATRGIGGALVRGSQAIQGVAARHHVGNKTAGITGAISRAGHAMEDAHGRMIKGAAGASKSIMDWGDSKSALGQAIKTGGRKFQNDNGALVAKVTGGKGIVSTTDRFGNLTKNDVARIGAGLAGIGLGTAAGYNSYRAATTKRAAKKAAQFRAEMNKTFAGTKYANGRPASQKKRRK